MRTSKKFGIVALSAVVLAGVAACGGSDSSTTSAGDVLTIALPTPPVSLDPSRGGQGHTEIYQATAYQGLLHLDGSGTTQSPSLAKSFEWADSKNTQLKIVLRDGLKFSDGTVLDSAAVKTSVEHFATNGSAFASVGAQIASVETPDATTVIFTLKASDPTFPYQLAETSGLGMIISPKAIAAKTNLGTSTVGAGPYQLSTSDSVTGSKYTYVPNKYYYDKSAVKYKKVVIKVIPDASTALAALQSGQVQIAYSTPDGNKRAESAGLKTAAFPGVTNSMYFLDDGKIVPAMANPDVRRAINFAIDRKAAAEVVTLGTGTPTAQLPPPDSFGYDAGLEEVYPFDLDKAKQLMADAGFEKGFTLPVIVPTFIPTSNNLGQVLAEQLSKIGVTLKIEGASSIGAYAAASGSGKFAASIFTLGFPLGIPSASSTLFTKNATGNPSHLDFPTVMPAIEAASALPADQAGPAWKAINKTIVDEALEAPVMNESYGYFYSKGTEGVADAAIVNPIFISPGKA